MTVPAVAPPAGRDVVIAARGLVKTYGSHRAVDAINLDIRRGEIFGLLGPNGAGKTTTILMMLGLTEVSGGSVDVLGYDPVREPLEVKRRVGYLPDAVGFEDMMALAHSGLTACLGIERMGGLAPGQVLFVNGGAGNVGRTLVQVATGLGARVIATAGTAAGRDTCRADGAVAALDYRSPTLGDELRAAAPGGIDVAWDLSGQQDLGFALAHLRRRGRIVVMSGLGARPQLPVGALYVNDITIVGFAITYATVEEMQACAARINALAAAGRLRGTIARRLPLSAAREAHRLIEDKSVRLDGKIVVIPD